MRSSIPMSSSFPLLQRALAASLMVALAHGIAHAGQGFANVKQNIFVAARASQTLTVIDTNLEQVIGALELGLEPKQLAVSDSVAKLAAIDGKGRRIVLVELVSGDTEEYRFRFCARKTRARARWSSAGRDRRWQDGLPGSALQRKLRARPVCRSCRMRYSAATAGCSRVSPARVASSSSTRDWP